MSIYTISAEATASDSLACGLESELTGWANEVVRLGSTLLGTFTLVAGASAASHSDNALFRESPFNPLVAAVGSFEHVATEIKHVKPYAQESPNFWYWILEDATPAAWAAETPKTTAWTPESDG
ncbi:MAG: hypothetical protein HQK60_01855 [Deltaproteobacteria bacterium]|nr:hypothetical protein [Deltaproteobacteria bacterium]